MQPIGALHLISAIVAIGSGTTVLLMPKGNLLHKRVGYLYFYSMLYMNGSAFMIYNLTGELNGFHIGSIVSLVTILIGIGTLYFRGRIQPSINLHISMMYWSMIGLYSALFSELLTRLSNLPFLVAVIIPTAVITVLGAIVFVFKGKEWFR